MNKNQRIFLVIACLWITAMLLVGVYGATQKAELGSAICEQEYGLGYKGFMGNTLECKSRVIQKQYNGLDVRVVG